MSLDTQNNREDLAAVRAELEQIGARLTITRERLEDVGGPAVPTLDIRDDAARLIYEAGQKVHKLQRRIEWRLSGRESY